MTADVPAAVKPRLAPPKLLPPLSLRKLTRVVGGCRRSFWFCFELLEFLILMSICTNCALLAWQFDEEGKWKIEPGLVVILIMEHALLLIKFGFSRLVLSEPAWVRATCAKNSSQARDMYTKRLLRTISGGEKTRELKKIE
ncbi:hypothetical protein Ahy_A01g001848 [Arachis hypogaea]|uniref:Anoctamin transmembrane domain-containing protein n=1 Tax=Arachis hypogaea TaxID=3818 RepID=A0A445EQ15_ARAHY|nr:hypothetical protein Ahy_A01g001848 [Arachis hypogaea]